MSEKPSVFLRAAGALGAAVGTVLTLWVAWIFAIALEINIAWMVAATAAASAALAEWRRSK